MQILRTSWMSSIREIYVLEKRLTKKLKQQVLTVNDQADYPSY